MDRVVGIRVHGFVLAALQQQRIVPLDARKAVKVLRRKDRRKLRFQPLAQVGLGDGGVAAAPAVNVIGKVQEVRQAQLLGADVADVGDPDLAHAVVVGHRHLLPQAGQVGRADPLEGLRAAVHVLVVIHAKAAVVGAHGRGGQRAGVAAVVVRQHQRDAVELGVAQQAGDFVRAVQEAFDLGEQHKLARHARKVGVDLLADEAVLRFEDAAQKLDVLAQVGIAAKQRGVALAAHAQRDDVFKAAVAAQPVAPEAGDPFGVGRKVPGVAVGRARAAHAGVFLAAAHAGFVVGGGHDDAELVGQLGALQAGAVQAEIGGPHRGPEIVALETQQQLEHLRIAGGVDAAEVGARPGAERGPFIVDEKAAVAHGRLFGEHLVSLGQRDCIPAAGPDMVPVHKRRDADALGQVEQAVDRAALVAARNDQRTADAGQRVLDEGEEVDLPFSAHAVQRDLAALLQRIQHGAAANGAIEHGGPGRIAGRGVGRAGPGDKADILLHHARHTPHAGPGGLLMEKAQAGADGQLFHSAFLRFLFGRDLRRAGGQGGAVVQVDAVPAAARRGRARP